MEKNKQQHEYDIEMANDSDFDESDLSDAAKAMRSQYRFSAGLEAERQKAVQDRRTAGIDDRLVEASRLYMGKRDSEGGDSLVTGVTMPKVGSKVYHNITRQITNDGAAQLGDLLFPSDDKNYGLRHAEIVPPPIALENEPAVDSKGEPLVDAGGTQLTNKEAHYRRIARAEKKTKRMFSKIDNSLIASKYPAKARKCIFNAAHYGTGILKGVVPNQVSNGRWSKKKAGEWGIRKTDKMEADTTLVSPFDFYPDMSASSIDEAAYVWERSYLRPEQLYDASQKQRFDRRIVNQLLTAGAVPYASVGDEARTEANESTGINPLADGRYEVWERHGVVSREDLEAYGVEVKGNKRFHTAVVFMCNGKVLKIASSPYERDDTSLYSVFCWDEDPLGIFGLGIPQLMADPQREYAAVWRMVIDNGGLASQPQVVIDKTKITPADGSNDYTLTGGKIWNRTGDTYSNENANFKPFELFPITLDIQYLFTVMDRATQDAYELTGVTKVQKTNASLDNSPVTLGATNIQQNNSTVSRRALARRYDDCITATLIQRYYDFYMQFEDDIDIKAAMVVEPRGATVLLAKELQANNLMQFFNITQGGQLEGIKLLPLLRSIANVMQFPEGKFIETDVEMEKRVEEAASQEAPVDPMIELEGRKVEVMEAEVEINQGKLTLAADKATAEFQLKKQQQQFEQDFEVVQLDRDDMKFMANREDSMKKIDVDFQIKQSSEKTKRDVAAVKINADRVKDKNGISLAEREIATKERSQASTEAELNYKMTTGDSGI
jgi:hypothetical protein